MRPMVSPKCSRAASLIALSNAAWFSSAKRRDDGVEHSALLLARKRCDDGAPGLLDLAQQRETRQRSVLRVDHLPDSEQHFHSAVPRGGGQPRNPRHPALLQGTPP